MRTDVEPELDVSQAFTAPDSGIVHIKVRASDSVRVYVMHEDWYREYVNGTARIRVFYGTRSRTIHDAEVDVPPGDRCYLVVYNPHKIPVRIDARIYSVG